MTTEAYLQSIHHSHATLEELQTQIDDLHYGLEGEGESGDWKREQILTLLRRKNAILNRTPPEVKMSRERVREMYGNG